MAGQNSKPSSGEYPVVDVSRIADGLSNPVDSSKLVDVIVVTKSGARYVFPDMPSGELERVLPESGRQLETQPSFMMVNASIAVLTIPFRVIKSIETGGKVLWACPA
jgi:hypothetical protein